MITYCLCLASPGVSEENRTLLACSTNTSLTNRLQTPFTDTQFVNSEGLEPSTPCLKDKFSAN